MTVAGLLCHINLAGPSPAIPVVQFLDSIGANSAINQRGETLDKTTECAKYLGLRWFRAGIEGGVSIDDFVKLHAQTGVRFSWGLGSGASDLSKLLSTARLLAPTGALLAFEGPNEPNNWGITYEGQAGGRDHSWLPVAHLQRDMYRSVKSDSVLKKYPVWGISEIGAESDNVGLQFLTVPVNSGAIVPAGTTYADFANVHNYIYHPNSPNVEDNKTWNAADPSPACRVDGLYGEHGKTWARHFQGYSPEALEKLPRVTTETGCVIEEPVTEEIHALNILSLYLDQFKRGWSYTALYLLRDRVDEGGNQQYGFYRPDYTPRKAAVYLHNLTSTLADTGKKARSGKLSYAIPNEPNTVHDLLLQKSNGLFDLVVWSERVSGSVPVSVQLGRSHRWVKVYDPTLGVAAQRTLKDVSAVPLEMSNHPLILEIEG